ncbi:MAG TPA: hypothetical protein VHT02_06495 [Methylocella sp.]|nr:hypothetical protein [Methylocella sp.]
MASAGYLSLSAVLMGAAAISAAHAQDGVAVRLNLDGIYAVDITTRQGSCERDYHWKISVSGGRISSAGDTPMAASGEISQRGIVDVAFRRFGQVATVIGKLAMGSGSGTWSSTTLQCAGSWRATRQG